MAILNRAKNAALTYPQVLAPRVAANVVRALTSGSRKTAPKPKHAAVYRGTGLDVGHSGERYAPEQPASGRTDGIRVAQAAAAPAVPASPVDQTIRDAT